MNFYDLEYDELCRIEKLILFKPFYCKETLCIDCAMFILQKTCNFIKKSKNCNLHTDLKSEKF